MQVIFHISRGCFKHLASCQAEGCIQQAVNKLLNKLSPMWHCVWGLQDGGCPQSSLVVGVPREVHHWLPGTVCCHNSYGSAADISVQ